MNTQLSNSIKEVIVAIPIYKEQPSESEIISLRQGLKILRNHEIVIFTYKGLELSIYEQIAEDCDKRFRVEYFSKAYFESVDGYNQLMMRTEFYHRFAEYEYLFIYQLDAFVFKDDLLLWCRRGYDYIGAPWIDLKNGKYRFLAVGNGGFSLRKVSYCQRILQLPRKKCLIKPFYPCTISPPKTFRSKISPYIMAPFRLLGWKNTIQWYIDHINEDGLFSWYIQQSKYSVNLPSCEEAVYFAFELYPQYCYQVTKGVLPFGCHAFMKYEYEVFWKEIIQREYVG